MKNELILARIEQQHPGFIVSHDVAHDGILNVETPREQVFELLKFLRDDEELHYHFLTSLCGIHYPENAGRELGVIYHLHNWPQNRRLRVKTFVPLDDPHVPTVTTLWPTANWMERQEYDFFGIIFTGHPDLRRILNVDDLDVFPMRKEYRLEDGTRTDKDDRFFGRKGHEGREFD
ncbi:MAG: NADH-quinone oxidoreductase subunit C [Saprospiraceae bacterium]|nr:NADH-quinone oxidoreductase subunit C [Saprospiraceae bacterium]